VQYPDSLIVAEWLALYVGFPIFVWADLLSANKLLLFFVPVGYSALVYFYSRPEIKVRKSPFELFLGLRILLITLILIVLAYLLVPAGLFSLPREKQTLWILIMLLYPVISVLPQEFFFRRFYFWRYERLFPNQWVMMVSSAIAFMFVHIVYDNWVALILTLAGGLLFSSSYMWTRRLSVCWFEHTVYGLVIFTVGLGSYFYETIN
jgi:membrane protease YdiL (CAAX protease family)